MKLFCVLIGVAIIFSSCDNKTNDEGLEVFNADTIKHIISQLSSDEFEGRKPFTAGETKSVEYIKNKFSSIGLEPGDKGNFFQDVPMVEITAIADKQMQMQSPSGLMTLKAYDDYIIWTDRTEPVQSFNKDEVVFAGYGVVAPEHGWNDYAGLDVKGKIVMVLVNDPGFNAGDTTLFKGKRMTYYGRWTYKYEEAARQGAKGCLIVHETKAAGYPMIVLKGDFNTARLQLDRRGKTQNDCNIIGWVSDTAAKKMISAGGINADSLIASADRKGFRAVTLPLKLSTQLKVSVKYNISKNVIGKISGSKYPDETIIYSAHWDHLGIGEPDDKGDSIYNGALDNASGIAGLYELARAFKRLSTKPERTVVFLAVTAEEQGLWGSAYYAQNPVFPLEKTVANINMDGINYWGRTKDVVPIGKGQSELEDLLSEKAATQDRYIGDEERPEVGSYFRSDHFMFAKAGVPALYARSGVHMEGKTVQQVMDIKDAYTKNDYHRPSDELTNAWVFDGAIEDLQLFFMVGKDLAYAHNWPHWKSESEFRAIREKTDAQRK